MKKFIVKSGNYTFNFNADNIKVNDKGMLLLIENHELSSMFKEWDYFYETSEEEIPEAEKKVDKSPC